jgi:hypothetical protein
MTLLFTKPMEQLKNGLKHYRILENKFEKNIFINCPFDLEYYSLLRPLLFTVIYCGYNPRIALERFDSSEIRLDKIKQLIDESSLSIHDLSKIKSTKKNEYFRLNMPFEIGLDLGCKLYHADPKYRNKKSLILEKERYAYQKALSDISNSDVKCHNGEPEDLILEVRNWFSEIGNSNLKSGSNIWDDYNLFYTDFYLDRTTKGFKDKDIEKMPISEFVAFIEKWIFMNNKSSIV